MANPRPIQFRAVHDITRWRAADHETEKHASVGRDASDVHSAVALFDGRNKAIDYVLHGPARYVVIWDPRSGAESGTIVRPDSSEADGLGRADIPMDDVDLIEAGGMHPSTAEFDRYFVRLPNALDDAALFSLEDVEADFNERLRQSLQRSSTERNRRLKHADPVPPKIEVRTSVFRRNTDVVAEVLDRAGGRCEGCHQPAPFSRKTDGSPYLEVHHRVRLADGGPDTVRNASALCPNCHRLRHFGSYSE